MKLINPDKNIILFKMSYKEKEEYKELTLLGIA